MANMSYCRFQNTLSDLSDCEEALENDEGLSNDEYHAALRLIELCGRMVLYTARLKTEDEED